MKRRGRGGYPELDPELEAFLEPRKIERHAPADVRARALARGRAIVAAGGAIRPAPVPDVPVPLPAPVGRRRLVPVALAASMAVAAGALAAAGALHGRAAHAPRVPAWERPHQPPVVPDERFREPSAESPTVTAKPAPTGEPTRPARVGDTDPLTAELDLLGRAQAAYTRRNFSTALALIAKHSRRFPDGHLAEQREALRVRSLAGAGRIDEARRAAAAFVDRFPRSVLLPSVEQTGL